MGAELYGAPWGRRLQQLDGVADTLTSSTLTLWLLPTPAPAPNHYWAIIVAAAPPPPRPMPGSPAASGRSRGRSGRHPLPLTAGVPRRHALPSLLFPGSAPGAG